MPDFFVKFLQTLTRENEDTMIMWMMANKQNAVYDKMIVIMDPFRIRRKR
jgi:hypothetical protein